MVSLSASAVEARAETLLTILADLKDQALLGKNHGHCFKSRLCDAKGEALFFYLFIFYWSIAN